MTCCAFSLRLKNNHQKGPAHLTTASLLSTLRPVGKAERIQILDILRGFAVFGILAVNIGGFPLSNWVNGGITGVPVLENTTSIQ